MASFHAPFEPCFDVRLNLIGHLSPGATLTQRSNDMLVAHHIQCYAVRGLADDDCQAFRLEGWESSYFINNLHIYDNQFEQAEELLVVSRQTTNHAGFKCSLMGPISLISSGRL